VDLETMPLHVRAGALLPLGPIRQYADGPVDSPLTLVVYPGSDGLSALYEDDGRTFNYRQGEWMRIEMDWRDATRRLTLRLARGSRMLPPARRSIKVRVAGERSEKTVVFTGRPVRIHL